MFDMPEEWVPVLNALLKAPIAWQTPAELAVELKGGLDETMELLSDMDVDGWIEVWDYEPGPRIALSSLAAERLKIHLVEVGPGETPRWAHLGDPAPPCPRAKHVCQSSVAAALEFAPDNSTPPPLAAERAERARRQAALLEANPSTTIRAEDLPWPTHLVGQGLVPWPGPTRDHATVCPACGNRRLKPHMYCLCCDRWGMDGLLPPSPGLTSKSTSLPSSCPIALIDPRKRQLEWEMERTRRKARRKAKHQIRFDSKKRPRPPAQ
jgi:hypothetical protein